MSFLQHKSTLSSPNARNSFSFTPSRHGNLLLGKKISTNICLPSGSPLRGLFWIPHRNTNSAACLYPRKFNEKRSGIPPLKDMFFARKSCRFYVPKIHLKNANGCSVCAWLLTSGGLRLTLRFALGRRPSAPLSLTNRPLNHSIFYHTKAPKTWTLRDEKRGGERSRPHWPAQDRLPLFPAAYAFFLRSPIPYLSMLSVSRDYSHAPPLLLFRPAMVA